MKNDDNTKDGMHLTVTKDGLVSLWDDAPTAQRSAPGETYLLLPLTDEQRKMIVAATVKAAFKEPTHG